MSYYLSSNDIKVLKQTINTVNNISTNVGQGKRPTIKNAFAYAELTEVDADGFWSAIEVYFDETGTPNELEDGRTWGGDEPSIIVNGDVSAGQVMRIESYYLVDSNDEEQSVWVGSAVGGGSMLYAYIKSGSSNKYTVDVYSQPTLDDKFKVDEDIEALAYNVTYGDISHNNFLIFSYGIDESSGTDGYLTSSVWL